MTAQAVHQGAVSAKLIGRWKHVNQKLVALAEDVPESKFDYRPTAGVRSFADVLRHVAFWNRYVADSARGAKVDDAANELPKAEFSTKTRILDALKASVEDATMSLNHNPSGLSPEMAEMLVTFIEHNCEHYGQLVVYARLNGLVPPSSRG